MKSLPVLLCVLFVNRAHAFGIQSTTTACFPGRSAGRGGKASQCRSKAAYPLESLICAESKAVDACNIPKMSRRNVLASSVLLRIIEQPTNGFCEAPPGDLVKVVDPQTYEALAFAPRNAQGKLPLIIVLHGAGKNEKDAWNLADLKDEHAGLAPSLLASGTAPPILADNFAVIAPYAAGKRSFYEEPRAKLLQFVEWACSDAGRRAGCPDVDPRRVFLFGFSDGATVAVELLTTRRFAGGVIAAYGFTGELPGRALERLRGVPVWAFHSADDAIFDVQNSDRLVRALRQAANTGGGDGGGGVKFTRYERDQEGFTGAVRGHSTGITASRQPAVYSWLLSLPPTHPR